MPQPRLRPCRFFAAGFVGAIPIVCAAVIGLMGCQPQPEPVAGASGAGDPYYSELGNGGYDVQKYSISLDIDPGANTLKGKVKIEAKATEYLKSLNLDLLELEVDSVTVNNSDASFTRQVHELTIVPTQALRAGSAFLVEISYHGSPQSAAPIASPDAALRTGWLHSASGVINIMSEPNGAASWFPVNDHPRDKALYRFEIAVPKPWVVAASGSLRETHDEGALTRSIWEMDKPMASYLASINVGHYMVDSRPGAGGVTLRNYVPPGLPETLRKDIAAIPAMLEAFSALFGPYPFDEYGILITADDIAPCGASFGGAVEVQTLSVYCPDQYVLGESMLAHELAHQWFGDDVSLKNWQDIWLKEGMATYAEWLWLKRDAGAIGLNEYANEQLKGYAPNTQTGRPPATDLYRDEVYTGGALVFHALRLTVGDETFFKILRTYLERYRFGNASTDEFIAVAEEVSGQELSAFFDAWLYATTPPTMPNATK